MKDLIYRQSAINAIENTECELLPEEWDELTGAIKQVPPEQQWIPMSERPPEKPGRYIVTNCEFEVDWNIWVNGEWLYQNDAPIAWMNMPEPYEGGEPVPK